ncbi:hypothetical protein DMN91_001173 [Ooceraea biroi]|uniref:Uncharacterized protein n=1 Tax=Ooceraea biroi TaxID=2015173 RepID=A0A3L8E3U6_OOCBI|nr:hypothetical protein DMN91_001173 [Ooceraea biroi]
MSHCLREILLRRRWHLSSLRHSDLKQLKKMIRERKPTRSGRPIVHRRPIQPAVVVPTPADNLQPGRSIGALSTTSPEPVLAAAPRRRKATIRAISTVQIPSLQLPLRRQQIPAPAERASLAPATRTSPALAERASPARTSPSPVPAPTLVSPVAGTSGYSSATFEDEPPPRICEDILPWALREIQLSPPRRTRPPRNTLDPWDIRVRRLTSPRLRRSSATPSPRNRPTSADKENVATQTNISWVDVSSDESPSPPRDKWGPILVTLTKPHLSAATGAASYKRRHHDDEQQQSAAANAPDDSSSALVEDTAQLAVTTLFIKT